MKAKPCLAPDRRSLEDAWRALLQQKESAYRVAAAGYGKLLEEKSHTPPSDDLESAIQTAKLAAAGALEDYTHALRVFTGLTIYGKLPEETIQAETIDL